MRVYKYATEQRPICNAIKKHGWRNFSVDILACSDDIQLALNVLEPMYIFLYASYHHGYNATLGGDGVVGKTPWNKGKPRSEKTKQKIRNKKLGHVQSRETVAKRVAKTKGQKRDLGHRLLHSKVWLLEKPDGSIIKVANLQAFCRENGLTASCLHRGLKHPNHRHKGWRIVKDLGAATLP